MKVTRSELYEMVWGEPIQRLAERFGMSDVALAKRCRKVDIPLPGRGYWARQAVGRAAKRPPLPSQPPGIANRPIVFPDRVVERQPAPATPAAVLEQKRFEERAENRLAVSERLSKHAVVRATRDALRDQRGAAWAQVAAWGDGVLSLKVARQSTGRALRLLDAFVRGVEARGFRVHGRRGHDQNSHVMALGQCVEFRLLELQRRIDRQKAGEKVETYGSRYRLEGTGVFEFHIGHQYTYSRQVWRDGKDAQLEQRLNGMMVGVVEVADALKKEEEERERERAERQRRYEIQQEEEQQHANESRRITQLYSDADSWSRAEQLRSLADRVEADSAKRSEAQSPHARAWLAWVRMIADRLDPLAHARPLEFLGRDPE